MVLAASAAAVIGSGFGGLAVAIRLQAAGVPTVLFEARDQPGGRAYVLPRRRLRLRRRADRDHRAALSRGAVRAPPGGAMADYVELLPGRPVLPADLGRRRLASTTSATRDAMLAQIRRRSPARRRRLPPLRRLHPRRVFEEGYVELAATPFLRFADMVRVAPQLVAPARRPLRLRHGQPLRRATSTCARRSPSTRCSSAAIPFDTSSIYTLIHYLERKWGVFFPRGGTGALVARAGAALRRAGRRAAARRRRSSAVRPSRDGRRVTACTPAGHRATSTSSSRTPTCTTPTRELLRDEPRARRDRGGASSRSTGRCRSSSSTSVPTALPRRHRAPHRRSSARATRSCSTTSSRARASRRLQPLPARADGDRSVARARTAATPSTCSRRCRTSATRRSTGTRVAPALRRRASSRRSSASCPICAARRRRGAGMTPRDLPRRAQRLPGLGVLAARRRSRRAPGSGRTTAIRASRGLYLVGAGHAPGRRRAGRGQLGQGDGARSSSRTSPVSAIERPAGARARHRTSTRRASRSRRGSLPPAVRDDAAVALRVVPPRRRRDRPRAARRTSRPGSRRSAPSSTPSTEASPAEPIARRASRRSSPRAASRARTRTSCSPAWRWTWPGTSRTTRSTMLLRYCYRVAGTVGLMMCHVMGVRRRRRAAPCGAPRHRDAAHQRLPRRARGLGARAPLPARDLLAAHGAPALAPALGAPCRRRGAGVARAVADLLDRADATTAPATRALGALRRAARSRCARRASSTRRSARVLARRGCDPLAGRAVVSTARKLWLVARAAVETLARALRFRGPLALPTAAVGYSVVRLVDEEVGS